MAWECPACTYLNENAHFLQCEICDTPRAGPPAAEPAQPAAEPIEQAGWDAREVCGTAGVCSPPGAGPDGRGGAGGSIEDRCWAVINSTGITCSKRIIKEHLMASLGVSVLTAEQRRRVNVVFNQAKASWETASSPATSPAEPIGVDESAPREEPPAAAQPSSHASAPPARSAPRPSNTDAPASSRQAAKQPAGNRITLQGLKSRPELNGCEIKIVQYIQETKRYKVSLPSGESISVKPQNLASAASVSTPKPASPELRTGSKRKLPEALGRGTGPGAESRRRMEDRRASLLSDSELEQPGSQDDPPDPLSDVLIAKRARFTASLIERAARLPATAKKRTVVTGSAKPAAKPPKPPTAGQKKPAQAQSKFHRGNQEITIDPATGATVTVNERKHLEARRRQEALNAQNNKQAASRRKSAVLVLGDRQSTERGRSKKILETHIRESRVGAFHQAKDSGEELAAEEMGGVGVGAMAGGWETSGGTHLI